LPGFQFEPAHVVLPPAGQNDASRNNVKRILRTYLGGNARLPPRRGLAGFPGRSPECPRSGPFEPRKGRRQTSPGQRPGDARLCRPFRARMRSETSPGRCPGLICFRPFGARTRAKHAMRWIARTAARIFCHTLGQPGRPRGIPQNLEKEVSRSPDEMSITDLVLHAYS
jgi:hypothetical protein